VQSGLDPDMRSVSGMTGGQAYKMLQRLKAGKLLCGPLVGKA